MTSMTSIEISIAGQKYILRGEEPESHLREVSELVRRRVESIRKQNPALSLQKVTMLAALDFASETIKQKRHSVDTRHTIVNQAKTLLARIEGELESVGRVPTLKQ